MSPLWLIGMLVTSGALYFVPFYGVVFLVQVAFYGLAVLGLVLQRRPISRLPVLAIPMSVVVANIAFLRGLISFLLGRRMRLHEPVRSVEGQ